MLVQKKTDLRPFNIWGVGGQSERLIMPASIDELASYVRQADDDHLIYMLGLGSNVLVLDQGFPGTVVLTYKHLSNMKMTDDGCVYAQCGVTQPRLARFLATNSLAGGEFHASIPGTVGGALAMNAGAFGGQTWDHVVEVDTMDRSGRICTRAASEFEVGYRRVVCPEPNMIFIGARLRFSPGKTEDILAGTKTLLRQRAASQPVGLKSCGSVFINPVPLSAGRLIDECGLKGFRIGAAEVSTKHANFIINTGDARSGDIIDLVGHIQQQVQARHHQQLTPEFRFLGAPEDIPQQLLRN